MKRILHVNPLGHDSLAWPWVRSQKYIGFSLQNAISHVRNLIACADNTLGPSTVILGFLEEIRDVSK